MNEEMDNNSGVIKPSISTPASPAASQLEPVKRILPRQDNDDDGDNDRQERHSPRFFLSEGNRQFINKQVASAIQAYSRGLERLENEEEAEGNYGDQPRNIISVSNEGRECERGKKNTNNFSVYLDLLSNRSLVYLSNGNYTAALEDTRKVLLLSPKHFKGAFRHAKALVGLGQFQSAIDCIEGTLNCDKDKDTYSGGKFSKEERKELLNYLKRLKWTKHQSETGENFDVPLIMDRPFDPAPLDWADYIGKVTVEHFPRKGRGLVATEDLPPSTLIMACRAFEILFLDWRTDPAGSLSEDSLKALNSGGFKVEEDVTLNLFARKVYDRLVRNPERRKDFYQLHAGNDLGHLEPPSESAKTPPLDMARIYGICRTNTFANSGDSYPEVEKSVGVWLFPAYVNHQCIGGNCTWKIFGDFIFVRTFKPVKKGEELTHSYVSPAYSLQARTNVLTKRLGFVCNCKLCELDRNLPESVHQEKDKLKQLALNQEVKFAQLEIPQDSEDYRKKVDSSILLLEQIISKLEKMQPHHGPYNASLLDPLQKLGLKYFGIGQFQKTVKVMERACSLMTSCMLPHAIADAAMWIIGAYLHMGNNKQAKKWGKVLKENLIMSYGDVGVLKVLGPWVLEPMKQWGFV